MYLSGKTTSKMDGYRVIRNVHFYDRVRCVSYWNVFGILRVILNCSYLIYLKKMKVSSNVLKAVKTAA